MLARRPSSAIGDEEFLEFCEAHPDQQVELVGGEFVMSPPMGWGGSMFELRCGAMLLRWADEHGYVASGSQGGVRMRNSDIRIPDVALLKRSTWDTLDDKARSGFANVLCDVVVEIVSKTDRVSRIERKCEDVWLAGGHRFVLMIDPIRKRVRSWGMAPPSFPSPEEILAEILR